MLSLRPGIIQFRRGIFEMGRLTERDLRGLTPLFWSNVALHGMFERDLDKRIDYDRGAGTAEAVPDGKGISR